ncbi:MULTISPECIES: hypothetical protein [unclassified Nocardiopsis]|uniref:hypothetical protein n=1 Tax=Nocardiopsis TaxID=2013 RepID=UPI00387B8E7B
MTDPYLDPASGALRNHLGIADPGRPAREAGYRIAWERPDGARNDEASAASTAHGDRGPLRAMPDGLVEPA